MATALQRLLPELRACAVCEPHLPLGAKPIFQLDRRAPILIAGQAPGRVAHEKGRPFDDASGDRLRAWLGVPRETFYDPRCFAIVPMGMCFPGTGKGGDLPPRPECAPLWRDRVLAALPGIRLTLAIGSHALGWHLRRKASVDELVAGWREGLAHGLLPLPHPSPRNQRWLRDRPWFEAEVLPALREEVAQALAVRHHGARKE
ncbi:uracil-DNA glycosylase family protein [Roseateles sp. BYS78W]|uniref:Uracil-DNA glycosylase family protein n=1 Tax=Pelomonas candidula TaxID=3299025 RepID=A0ABW7H6J0_9BURK